MFNKNSVNSSFIYKITKIQENFGEYCLNLRLKDIEIKGIYLKNREKLVENQYISCFFYLDKSNEEIKLYAYILINKYTEKNIGKLKIKNIYNFKPEFLLNSINKMELFEEDLNKENVFIYLNLKQDKMKLFDPIEYEYYFIDKKFIKDKINIKKNEFIYLKFYLINDDESEILCNNLTFIQKANEFQIFSIIDQKISSKKLLDFNKLKKIEDKDEITLAFLFAKVVLKNEKEKYIILFDKFNRLIRLNYDQIPNLDLFDLLLIIKCKIQRDKKMNFIII